MAKFVKKDIAAIRGKQRFVQLVILDDQTNLKTLNVDNEQGVWDSYEANLEPKYAGAIRGITSIMDLKANLQSLPKEKFKDITPDGELVKEYEFKYQDLRAYGIKLPNEVMMILGGYKNQQSSDISKFRSLKEQYLKSIEKQKK